MHDLGRPCNIDSVNRNMFLEERLFSKCRAGNRQCFGAPGAELRWSVLFTVWEFENMTMHDSALNFKDKKFSALINSFFGATRLVSKTCQ